MLEVIHSLKIKISYNHDEKTQVERITQFIKRLAPFAAVKDCSNHPPLFHRYVSVTHVPAPTDLNRDNQEKYDV